MLKVIEQKPTKMIKERQEESMDVYDQIVAIEAMDLEDLDDATIEAIAAMYEDFLALSEDAQNLLDPEYVSGLASLVLDTVEGNVETLPGTVEDFDTAFNNPETKEQTVNDLLNAWRQHRAMIGLIIVHLIFGAYFAFKKRDVLLKTANN